MAAGVIVHNLRMGASCFERGRAEAELNQAHQFTVSISLNSQESGAVTLVDYDIATDTVNRFYFTDPLAFEVAAMEHLRKQVKAVTNRIFRSAA